MASRIRRFTGLFSAVLPFLVLSGHAAMATASESAYPFSVRRVGSGTPMILIPGFESSGEVWDGVVAREKDRHACHVLTLRGFAGQPPVPADVSASFLPAVRDGILRYIHDEHLVKPILVGHSLGGVLALWAASTEPGSVGPVVSVDGLPYLPALMNPAATSDGMRGQAEMLRKTYAGFAAPQMEAQARSALAAMMKDEKDVARAAAWAAASDPKTCGRALYDAFTTDLRDEVKRIASPVLLVGAAANAPDQEARDALRLAYEAQVAGIPRRTVKMAANARHFVMLDDPEFLLKVMDAFLTDSGR